MNKSVEKVLIAQPDGLTWFYIFPLRKDEAPDFSCLKAGYRSADLAADVAIQFYPFAEIEYQ
jgi:hypothetical protein